MSVKVQSEDFDIGGELAALTDGNMNIDTSMQKIIPNESMWFEMGFYIQTGQGYMPQLRTIFPTIISTYSLDHEEYFLDA